MLDNRQALSVVIGAAPGASEPARRLRNDADSFAGLTPALSPADVYALTCRRRRMSRVKTPLRVADPLSSLSRVPIHRGHCPAGPSLTFISRLTRAAASLRWDLSQAEYPLTSAGSAGSAARVVMHRGTGRYVKRTNTCSSCDWKCSGFVPVLGNLLRRADGVREMATYPGDDAQPHPPPGTHLILLTHRGPLSRPSRFEGGCILENCRMAISGVFRGLRRTQPRFVPRTAESQGFRRDFTKFAPDFPVFGRGAAKKRLKNLSPGKSPALMRRP